MNIVIAGAGDVGFHLAKLLVMEKHNITLIDTDQEVLDNVSNKLDVLTLRGDAAAYSKLQQAQVDHAHLILAVTTSEKTNLIAAIIAKKMGAKQVIARVESTEFLTTKENEILKSLGVDTMISPKALAAREISQLVENVYLTDIFEFEQGKVTLFGSVVSPDSAMVNKNMAEIAREYSGEIFRVIAIRRKNRTIVPRGNTMIRANDHIYCTACKGQVEPILNLIGKEHKKAKNVIILGGTPIAMETASVIEDDYRVKLIESNKERCDELVEHLSSTLVIHADPGQTEILLEEGMKDAEVVIALTDNTEGNIVSCLMAKEYGIPKTIAMVENMEYTKISQNIGVDSLINKKLIAANNIFRFVRKGQIEAITSLNGVDAEVIEFVVHKNNRLTKHQVKDLHFPEDAILGGVIRGEDSFIPHGNSTLQLDDRVIVFTLPHAIPQLEKIFK